MSVVAELAGALLGVFEELMLGTPDVFVAMAVVRSNQGVEQQSRLFISW